MSERTEPRGPVIEDVDAELHRQVRPSWWVQDGRPSSQVFKPLPKDNGLLSHADGRRRSAKEAYEFHRRLGFESLGTLTVPVASYNAADVPVWEDRLIAAEDGHDDDAHAVADLRALGRKAVDRLASSLSRTYGTLSFKPS